jgi:Mg/Co/Ni transporter MgtE
MNNQTYALKAILQQPTLEAMKHAINQLSVAELAQSLPTIALNKRILLFLLLEEATAPDVFRALHFEERIILLYGMESTEQSWILNLLAPAEQVELLAILHRGESHCRYAAVSA